MASPAPAPRDLAAQIGVRADLPAFDPVDLAARYGGGVAAARSKPFAGEANVGDKRPFSIAELSGAVFSHAARPALREITATLRVKSEHAYFYEDDSLDVDDADIARAADAFETTVWPTVTSAFGLPAIPGVDGDPRIIVLQADLGGGAQGYYNADDAYLRAARPPSNEAEMVYMDRSVRIGGSAFTIILAHEFQHLIHENNDGSEEAWVNEGLSEDASGLVGSTISLIDSFAAKPSTQLNAFDTQGSAPHYGAGAAFFRYLASRFGGDTSLGKIAREEHDGSAGVDGFLADAGSQLHFRDVFADWIAANVLDAESGPYANPARPLHVTIGASLSPGESQDGTANQFGTDYYSLDGLTTGDYVARFRGQSDVPVLPTSPPAGTSAMLWANAKDSVDTRLTREVDLTGAADPALTFKTWYDIEPWFDWGYVSASTDGGKTWRALQGDHTTADDPVQTAYGAGYTGNSGGGQTADWIDERVSLAQYAGRKILLRFEYVTDGSTHGEGWAIDDINLSGVNFHDADGSAPGWTSEGWVRIDKPLAQSYIVRVIEKRTNGEASVVDVPLDAQGQGELRFSAEGIQEATLAIAGSTEGTNQPAPYHVELARG